MGCYMSKPDERVYVTEGKGENFIYATASCQGWRREQEDAEDCLPYFDDDASLFVLCDGHGGSEVAKYTVKHFPTFLKNHPLYKEGKYKEALNQAFIDFDALLRTDEVMEELQKISQEDDESSEKKEKEGSFFDLKSDMEVSESQMQPSGSSSGVGSYKSGPSSSTSTNGSCAIVEDVDTQTLRQEAKIPLPDLINSYSKIYGIDKAKRKNLMYNYNVSPVVRAKRDDEDKDAKDSEKLEADSSNEQQLTNNSLPSGSEQGVSDPEANEELLPGPSNPLISSALAKVLKKEYPDDDTSDDSEFVNDSSSDDDEDEDDDDDDDDGDDENEEGDESSSKRHTRKKHKRAGEQSVGSSSDEDDEDDNEAGPKKQASSCRVYNDDDDDNAVEEEQGDDIENEEADDGDDEEEEEDEEDIDDEDEENDDDIDDDVDGPNWENIHSLVGQNNRPYVPGMDSGCTVVVALIKKGKLYVASAGDSRCIVIMRNGDCKPMSFDHKPEDEIENRRISQAGGRVVEGRVNGGLNLSRAFGDFTYKRKDLSAEQQMITPVPNVKTIDLDPEKVKYILLACDGIWNSMKNKKVTNFICKTEETETDDLVEICVKLFRNCIAPESDGDGTGCDNMTCILARFDKASSSENSNSNDLKSEAPGTSAPLAQKRSNNDCDAAGSHFKRRCIRL